MISLRIKSMPRLLELFSGTGSLSKVCQGLGWETLSLDNERNSNPDLLMPIADFDETMYPKKSFYVGSRLASVY